MLPGHDEGLVRAIGLRRLTASIVNVTIGAGIFVLPAIVARGLGPAAPLAYIVCAGVMALIVTCFASAGSRVSLTGGLYAYVRWRSAVTSDSSRACSMRWPPCSRWPRSRARSPDRSARCGRLPRRRPARAAARWRCSRLLALINIRGVAPSGRLIEAVTVAKLLPLVDLRDGRAVLRRRARIRDRVAAVAAGGRRARPHGDRADLRVHRRRGRAGAERRDSRSGAHRAARTVLWRSPSRR